MCAIVDANVRDQVFGDSPTAAGRFFRDWLFSGRGGLLVVGGKLKLELSDNNRNINFLTAYRQLAQSGRARSIPDADVDAETDSLEAQHICRSNDAHILALARLSGARLLFSNDSALQTDFRNPEIINNPRGSVYTTLPIGGRPYATQQDVGSITSTHRELLARTDLCARPAAP